MSGHSHWATIKHKKGAIDARRGKLWSKLSRAIIIAARHGGGDPTMNLKLRYAIDKARAVSMPRDNIERAIKRGTGEIEGITYEEITYEGYAPGGVAVMVDTLTDNRNRTSGEIRKIFERKGVITVEAAKVDEDALMGVALDAGAEDLRRDGAYFTVTTDPASFTKVKEAVEAAAYKVADATLGQVPKVAVDVDEETGRKVARLMEALDDHDDVQNVYTNANLTEAMMA